MTPAPRSSGRISRVHIQGFRSLEDARIDDLPGVAALIGANGSGKSNLIRFFEMLGWMLKSRQLALFVGRHGGGSDQLFGGSETTERLRAEIRIDTDRGVHEYRFGLAHASQDGLVFDEEAFRFARNGSSGKAQWQILPVGGREAAIVEAAQSERPGVNPVTARTVIHSLRDCSHYQFHNTSATSSLRKAWDIHTAPSRRLQRAFPRYDKRIHGPLIANRIGLDRMRAECPRFGSWLQKIEALPVKLSAAS